MMKASALFRAALTALVVGSLSAYWLSSTNTADTETSTSDGQAPLKSITDGRNPANSNPTANNIGEIWRSPSDEASEAYNSARPEQGSPIPIKPTLTLAERLDRPSIEQELKEIKLDENGDIILDHDALIQLQKAFDHGNLSLDNDAMTALLNIIYDSLPTKIGQQAAKVVKDYHDYQVAINQRAEQWGRPQSIDERIELLDEQIVLQSLFMGDETAGVLFSQENISTRKMLEGMNIAVDEALNRQEKNEKLDALFQQYAQADPNIMNWDSRYDQFLYEKQAIMDAGLTENEKETQLQQLYQHSFSASERSMLTDKGLTQI